VEGETMKEAIDRILEKALAYRKSYQKYESMPADAPEPVKTEGARKPIQDREDLFLACDAYEGILDRQTDFWKAHLSVSILENHIEEAINSVRRADEIDAVRMQSIIQDLLNIKNYLASVSSDIRGIRAER